MGKTVDRYYWSTMTIDEINEELESINSNYRIDFNYLVERKPYNKRRGIRRTDDKSVNRFKWLDNDYLDGATPKDIKIYVRDNPLVRVVNGDFKYVLSLVSLLDKIDKVKDGEAKDIYTRTWIPKSERENNNNNTGEEKGPEKYKKFETVTTVKEINNLFKENKLNFKVAKVRVSVYIYKDISDSIEDQNISFKDAYNPELILQDTTKPDTYYSNNFHTVYYGLKEKNLKWFNESLKKVYTAKNINKLLSDAGINLIADYDNNRILQNYGSLKLKCTNGHKIKEKYSLSNLLDAINKKKNILCPRCSGADNRSLQTSDQEKWFREELVSEINNSNYKNKVKISKIEKKERLDTKYQGRKNQKQDIDILIKFPKMVWYNGKKIKGIGIACNGPLYHSYNINKGIQKGDYYNNVNINDAIRYNSLKYAILNWNERNSSTENNAKASAKSFIENRIFPILRSIFEGNHEIYDQKTYSRQMQHQRLGEIAQALNDKCKVFEYGNIKIENLGKYFLLNKKRLAYTNDVFDSNKVKIWAAPLSDKFNLDNGWKKKICNTILHNDDYLKANKISKGTVDYINKNSKDTNLDLKQYDKVRERRQFAKLFEEIKKRTSK